MSRARLELSKADVAYVFVGLLTFAVALYTQANLMFWLCGLLAGGLLAAMVLPAAMLGGLEIERVLPEQATAGEDAMIRYRIRNRKRWLAAMDLTVAEWPREAGQGDGDARAFKAPPQAWALYVGPRQEATIAGCACPTRRGEVQLKGLWISSGFPFGVLRRRRAVKLAQRLVVFPRRYALRPGLVQRLVRHESVGRVPMRRAGGVDEFYGLREYRPGDSLKVIDWKHSARGRGWHSREMTMLTPPHLLVRLDLRPQGLAAAPQPELKERIEQAISLAASLLHDACRAGMRVGLQVAGVAGRNHAVAGGRGHLERMLRTLALLKVQDVGEAGVDSIMPSVIVRASGGQRMEGGRVAVLGAADWQQYLQAAAGGETR